MKVTDMRKRNAKTEFVTCEPIEAEGKNRNRNYS